MTTKTFFDKLPAVLAANPKLGAGIGATFHLKVAGVGEWTLDCRGATPTIAAGLRGKADCAVESSATDFESVLANPANAMKLYFGGKVKIAGNAILVAKLAPILGAVK